ncbi:hypothetical protein [Ideonella dechloratans]|uniref:hypothetical protein n=1 Tax=Ideonella dechloratans TaxID=36863 RepID=UPI0035B230C8
MPTASRFRCPACGFTVFNRRLTHCEACRAPLPESLRFDAPALARLERDAAEIDRQRAELARDAEAQEAERQRRRGDGG